MPSSRPKEEPSPDAASSASTVCPRTSFTKRVDDAGADGQVPNRR